MLALKVELQQLRGIGRPDDALKVLDDGGARRKGKGGCGLWRGLKEGGPLRATYGIHSRIFHPTPPMHTGVAVLSSPSTSGWRPLLKEKERHSGATLTQTTRQRMWTPSRIMSGPMGADPFPSLRSSLSFLLPLGRSSGRLRSLAWLVLSFLFGRASWLPQL